MAFHGAYYQNRSQLLRFSHSFTKSGKTQVEELKSLRKLKSHTWNHVAATLNDEGEGKYKMTIYINGKFDCKRDITGASEIPDIEKHPIFIGKPVANLSGFEKGFDGLLSDMRFTRK